MLEAMKISFINNYNANADNNNTNTTINNNNNETNERLIYFASEPNNLRIG